VGAGIPRLSRREREVLEALYELGRASAAQIRDAMANPPTYTAVRTHLGFMEAKGLVRHESDGTRYIYQPVVARDEMGVNTLRRLLQVFFDGSMERMVSAFVARKDAGVSRVQLDELARVIERAREEGR
jgi:predicted transcriptional regulator